MQSYTRRKLKEDRFATATAESLHWAADHRKNLIIGVVVLAVLVALGVGAYYYKDQREAQASQALGKAVSTMNAPLAAEGQVPPGTLTFATAADRNKAAYKAFSDVADKYGNTDNGKYARYMAGVVALNMGDASNGEKDLRSAADSSSKNVSSLAKFALASHYRGSNRDADAVRLYKEVIDANSTTVPAPVAQFELAGYYEAKKQNTEAVKLYEDISKASDAKSGVHELAQQRIQALTGQAPAAAKGAAPATK